MVGDIGDGGQFSAALYPCGPTETDFPEKFVLILSDLNLL